MAYSSRESSDIAGADYIKNIELRKARQAMGYGGSVPAISGGDPALEGVNYTGSSGYNNPTGSRSQSSRGGGGGESYTTDLGTGFDYDSTAGKRSAPSSGFSPSINDLLGQKREDQDREERLIREERAWQASQRRGSASPSAPAQQLPRDTRTPRDIRTTAGGPSGASTVGPSGPGYQEQWAREDALRTAEQRRQDVLQRRQDALRTAEQRRQDELFGRISGLYDKTPDRVSRTGGASFEQEQAARDSAFARAKEKAGQTARASMSSLQDVAAERGLMGSSVEAAQSGALVGGAAGDIGEFLREQAIQEAGAATGRADLEYKGNLQQRQQDMSQKQALLSLLQGLY